MLSVTNRQYEALIAARKRELVRELVAHCRQRFPLIVQPLDDAALTMVVARRVDRALARGWTLRGSVRLDLNLTLLFGVGFHDDPQYPWAARILGLSPTLTEQRRADRLAAAATSYLDDVHGVSGCTAVAALQRLEGALRAVGGARALVPQPSRKAFIDEVAVFWPEKAERVGPAGLSAVWDRAEEETARFGIDGAHGTVVLAVVMTAFGHRCLEDRVYPWIVASIADRGAPSQGRVTLLERKATRWMRVVTAMGIIGCNGEQ